jgi:2'-5' RNA ligase
MLRAAIPHHVTILYPFVAPSALNGEVVAEVAMVARQQRAFRFCLAGTDRFTNVSFMTVEPRQRFLDLIDAFQRAWPQYPRYDGEFTTVVPHVTIAPRPHPPAIEQRVAARLPLEIVADCVEIWRSTPLRGWRRHARVPLAAGD